MYANDGLSVASMTMDRQETLVELVDRMERAVVRLERIVHGDSELGTVGLNDRVNRLESDVREIKDREPAPFWWAVGFAVFVLAFGFMIGDFRIMMNVPTHVGVGMSIMLLAMSGVFFFAGFGWLRKWLR
jgi:hypothetical protein